MIFVYLTHGFISSSRYFYEQAEKAKDPSPKITREDGKDTYEFTSKKIDFLNFFDDSIVISTPQ